MLFNLKSNIISDKTHNNNVEGYGNQRKLKKNVPNKGPKNTCSISKSDEECAEGFVKLNTLNYQMWTYCVQSSSLLCISAS